MVRDPGERHGQGEEGILMHLPHLSQVILIYTELVSFGMFMFLLTQVRHPASLLPLLYQLLLLGPVYEGAHQELRTSALDGPGVRTRVLRRMPRLRLRRGAPGHQ